MIVEGIMNLGKGIMNTLYSLLGVLPHFDSSIVSSVDSVFEIMFDSIDLVGVFVDFKMVRILIPVVIAIINFDRILKIVMFVIKKIPIAGMK